MKFVLMVFIAHFMGDYYLQTGTIASRKSHSYFYTFIHSVCYVIPFYIIWVFYCDWNLIAFLCLSITAWNHWLIDTCKVYITLKSGTLLIFGKEVKISSKSIYLIDQLCHYVLMLLFSIGFMYFFPQEFIFAKIRQLNLEQIQSFLFLFAIYQPLYVSNRILFCKNHLITNCYNVSHCFEKIYSVLVGLLLIFKQYYALVLLFIVSIIYIYIKKMDSDLYRMIVGIFILNFAGYILLFMCVL